MKKTLIGLLGLGLSIFSVGLFALPNPAAVNCQGKHMKYYLIEQTGICVFKDGSYCEEWAFYRKECSKGTYFFPNGKFNKKKLSQYCISNSTGKPLVVKCSPE